MFSTFVENELHLIPCFREEGEQSWSSISLPLSKPILQVIYQKSDNTDLKKILFLLSAEQVEQINNISDVKITDVNLVSPGWLNKTGKWLLEPLNQIFVGSESEPGEDWQDVFIYHPEGGQSYIDSARGTREEDVNELYCIFDINNT